MMKARHPSSPHSSPEKKKSHVENTPVLAFAAASVLLVLTAYYSPLFGASSPSRPSPSASRAGAPLKRIRPLRGENSCDLFRGEWVPNPRAPYYTNETCWAIHDHQNCMKFGRSDGEFMKWKWKPDGCELPVFNPAVFLHLVRGKSLAFLGDSIGRNQMQSLMCLLSRVTYPVDVSTTPDEKFRRWFYPQYNFTMATFWSPFLVKAHEADPNGPTMTGLYNLYLDEPDGNWTTEIEQFDYVIVSAGHWFFRPSMYYEGGKLAGCHYCLAANVTDLTMYYGYRRAFRTVFRHLNGLRNFRGTTILRTFAPQHFENGEWNKGGDCVRTRPFRSNETRLDGLNMEMYVSQVEEYRAAREEAEARGRRFEILDVTEALLLRPDGHPSRYGHLPGENVTLYNDCVHWCLPGPIDNVNDFLLELLKRERVRALVAGRSGAGR